MGKRKSKFGLTASTIDTTVISTGVIHAVWLHAHQRYNYTCSSGVAGAWRMPHMSNMPNHLECTSSHNVAVELVVIVVSWWVMLKGILISNLNFHRYICIQILYSVFQPPPLLQLLIPLLLLQVLYSMAKYMFNYIKFCVI